MTRLPYLLAHTTPRESEPYLERQAERRAVDMAILGMVGVKLPWHENGKAEVKKQDQGIGEYCQGKCISECTMAFGEALWMACRTCPN